MAGYKTETYNVVEITVDGADRFNISKLVRKYQPQNKNIGHYIKTKKFADIFRITWQVEASRENTGESGTQKFHRIFSSLCKHIHFYFAVDIFLQVSKC
jgi:hypothetical protein